MGKYDALYRRRTFGIKPGLEVEQALLTELGDPHQAFGVIHVAGTNGKGSVAVLLAGILQRSGLTVGLYTSPHLVRFNERFRVNGESIEDSALDELVARVESAAGRVESALAREVTFFECTTAMAFEHFRDMGVKVAVVETGMGGRLDATNVVQPLLSVITPIGIDHSAYLGDSLKAIAGEKAGIIKAGRPVVLAPQAPDAAAVVRGTCEQRDAPLYEVDTMVSVAGSSISLDGSAARFETQEQSYGTVRTSLVGAHQIQNVAVAIAAYEAFCREVAIPPDRDAVKRACADARWPGRAQLIRREPPVILDGAHNADGARALADVLKAVLGGRPLGVVIGMCKDKDTESVLAAFGRDVAACWPVSISSERTLDPAVLGALAAAQGWTVRAPGALMSSLKESVDWARAQGGLVCVCGSLFLVGDVLSALESADTGEWLLD